MTQSFTKPPSFTSSQSPLKWLDWHYSLTQHKLYMALNLGSMNETLRRWSWRLHFVNLFSRSWLMAVLANFMVGLSSSLGIILQSLSSEERSQRGGCFRAPEWCNCHKGVKHINNFLYQFQYTVRQYRFLTFFLVFLSIKAEQTAGFCTDTAYMCHKCCSVDLRYHGYVCEQVSWISCLISKMSADTFTEKNASLSKLLLGGTLGDSSFLNTQNRAIIVRQN